MLKKNGSLTKMSFSKKRRLWGKQLNAYFNSLPSVILCDADGAKKTLSAIDQEKKS